MQQEHRIHIKGMACDRCVAAIHSALDAIGYPATDISLGEVTILSSSTMPDMAAIKPAIEKLGFSVLEDKNAVIVRNIKNIIADVYSGDYDFPEHFKFSSIIKERIRRDYDALSSIFSQMEGITIESYLIKYRLEKVKELLTYTDDTLSDIAFKLGFNSAAHLSRQFKEITSINTSHYREIKKNKETIAVRNMAI